MSNREGIEVRLKGLLIVLIVMAGVNGIAWGAPQQPPPVPALTQEKAAPCDPTVSAERELPPPPALSPAETGMIPQEASPLSDLPGFKAQPGSQEFLAYRGALRWAGGVIQALIVLLVVAHFAIYGYHHVRPTGRMVRRYSRKEVFLHAVLAFSFMGAWASSAYLILAKHVLGYADQNLALPFGRTASTVHITAGLLFLGALIALGVIWRPKMRFVAHDRDWLKGLGGYFSREHRVLPAGYFNAGQKVWFRASVLLGVAVSVSGALIYYPGWIGDRWDVILYMMHTALGVTLSVFVIGHVYLAVLAHPRAAGSMITGKVDEACWREHHPLEPLPPVEEEPT